MQNDTYTTPVTQTAPIATASHGGRAKCLQRLVRLDLPVPPTVALSFAAVHELASGALPDIAAIEAQFSDDALLCVRPSSEDPDWGGPGAVLNIGMNTARHAALSKRIGAKAANMIYLRFVQAYAVDVARLDPDLFEIADGPAHAQLTACLHTYERETEEPFPQERGVQLVAVLRSMARAWEGTSARLLRQAKGAPADAGLGLVVQQMVLGVGATGENGAGVLQLVDGQTGQAQITGRYLRQSQGRAALEGAAEALYLTSDSRGPSLQDTQPDIFAALLAHAKLMRRRLCEEMEVEFTIENGQLYILDGLRVKRGAGAGLRIAVDLARDGIISRKEALMRIDPRALASLLHRQIAPGSAREILGQGIAASPGAASGVIVFSATEAQIRSARSEPCILVRRETHPEDVRAMHVAAGVMTERGGMSSHAAVIGRGIGLPCIVGVQDIDFQIDDKELHCADGRILREGDAVTLDGTTGQVLAGTPEMIEAVLDDAFVEFMAWADEVRVMNVRANADTPADARSARNFAAQGIGLCRTEHMFFDASRLRVMREMIFADTAEGRRTTLERLLPMQRSDFTQIFEIMQGQPVCIRLFDPPLHEFLPTGKAGQKELADALDLPLMDVTRRIESMMEYNPMLGLRGVRLGVIMPEIYEMQAQAIFEATIEASKDGVPVVPEIMIPLVSAKREVELVRIRIDAVAAGVRAQQDVQFTYRLGVMVETPRAALLAGDIADHCAFLSFGTNDLTQMTYGLSRDDAGRFMSEYVRQQVYGEDPFHTLDTRGVGELLKIAARRGRRAQPDLTLSICGEHGGNPESIAFCHAAGFDYVSCSPFRVPVARLAAAQLAIVQNTPDKNNPKY